MLQSLYGTLAKRNFDMVYRAHRSGLSHLQTAGMWPVGGGRGRPRGTAEAVATKAPVLRKGMMRMVLRMDVLKKLRRLRIFRDEFSKSWRPALVEPSIP